ncbi:MAG: hypothetical protein ACQEXE_16575 [Bacillota bacterium]
MNEDDFHKIHRNNNGLWEEVGYNALVKDNHFRMFYPDGKPFIDSDNKDTFVASSDPFYDEELGVWLIQIK